MHLSTLDQERIADLLATADHETLALIPSWPPLLDDAYLASRARSRSRAIVSRCCLEQAARRASIAEIRTLPTFSVFLLVADRRAALVKRPGRPLGRVAVRADLDRLVADFTGRWNRSVPVAPPVLRLSELQAGILRRLATGMTDQAAAAELAISPRTVQRQVSQVMRALGARSRLELGVYLASTDLCS